MDVENIGVRRRGHGDDGVNGGAYRRVARRIAAAVAALLLVAAGIAVGLHWESWFGGPPSTVNLDESAEDWTGARGTYTGDGSSDSIAIPGFDTLTVKAGATEQQVNLYNPEGNPAYFRMSIILPDGTTIWRSDLVAPGKAIYTAEFARPVDAGVYENVTLRYECFAMDDDLTPLNGSEASFTLKAVA